MPSEVAGKSQLQPETVTYADFSVGLTPVHQNLMCCCCENNPVFLLLSGGQASISLLCCSLIGWHSTLICSCCHQLVEVIYHWFLTCHTGSFSWIKGLCFSLVLCCSDITQHFNTERKHKTRINQVTITKGWIILNISHESLRFCVASSGHSYCSVLLFLCF